MKSMIPKNLTNAELEDVFDRIAEAVDRVGEEQSRLFLAKLAFSLANLVGRPEKVREMIEICEKDL